MWKAETGILEIPDEVRKGETWVDYWNYWD
jgi:hypothetical protein